MAASTVGVAKIQFFNLVTPTIEAAMFVAYLTNRIVLQ